MKDKNPKVLKSEDLKEPWVEAFKTGPVKDMAGNEHNFSEADLADLNEGIHGQLDAGYQPPMVKGHPEVDSPRVASIVDSKVDGNVLKVKLDDVNPDFAEEVKKGGFKYLSASIYSNLKKGLRHLGALGAHAPAMKGMAPICFGEGMFAESDKGAEEQDVCVFAESYDWDRLVPASVFERLVWKIADIGRMFRSQREQLIEKEGIEAADKAFPEYTIKNIEDIEKLAEDAKNFPKQQPKSEPAQPAADASFAEGDGKGADGSEAGAPEEKPAGSVDGVLEEKPAQTEVTEPVQTTEKVPGPQATTPHPTEPSIDLQGHSTDATRLSEENAALKAELDALKADKLAAERLRASAAFSEKLDAAIGEGRCNQVMKDNLMKVFGVVQKVPVDGDGCFADADERVNPMQLLDDAVKALPKIVELGEFHNFAETKETAAQKITKYKAEQEANGRKLTFAEAAEECNK